MYANITDFKDLDTRNTENPSSNIIFNSYQQQKYRMDKKRSEKVFPDNQETGENPDIVMLPDYQYAGNHDTESQYINNK